MGSSLFFGSTFLFSIIYFCCLLMLLVLGIYFLITAIKFMKERNKYDRELLVKIDELIQLTKKEGLPPKDK